MLARYQLDGWAFLGRLFWFDFVARSATALEGHAHGPLFYLDILQKHHYDWLLAAAAALLLAPPALDGRVRTSRAAGAGRSRRLPVLFAAWAAVTLLLPTLMQTKLPWYLNPFYPLFALARRHSRWRVPASGWRARRPWRRVALAGVAILMFAVAESQVRLVLVSLPQPGAIGSGDAARPSGPAGGTPRSSAIARTRPASSSRGRWSAPTRGTRRISTCSWAKAGSTTTS